MSKRLFWQLDGIVRGCKKRRSVAAAAIFDVHLTKQTLLHWPGGHPRPLHHIEAMALMFGLGPPIEEASGTWRHELRCDGLPVGALSSLRPPFGQQAGLLSTQTSGDFGWEAFRTQSMPDPAAPALPAVSVGAHEAFSAPPLLLW